jgi:hypothetical protein
MANPGEACGAYSVVAQMDRFGLGVYTVAQATPVIIPHCSSGGSISYVMSSYIDQLLTVKYAPIYLMAHYFDYATGSRFISLTTLGAFQATYKIHILLADWAMAFIFLRTINGYKGILAAMMLLFNPFFFYHSATISQGDTLMAAFVLIGSYMIYRDRVVWGSVFLGLGVLTLQYALYVLVPILVLVFFRRGARGLLRSLTAASSTVLVVSLPFMVFGSAIVYLEFVFLQYLLPQHYVLALIPTQDTGNYFAYISTYTLARSGLLPPSPFNGLWSVMGYLNSIGASISASTALIVALNVLLLGVVLYSIARKLVSNAVLVALLGLGVFELVGTGAGDYYVIGYIPIAVMTAALGMRPKPLCIFLLISPVVYSIAEYASQLLGVSPPLYIGDTFLSLVLLMVIGLAAFGRIKLESDQPKSNDSGAKPGAQGSEGGFE